MRYRLAGTTMQTLSIDLEPHERIYSQTSQMAWMSANMQMNTHTGGGMMSGVMRSLSGGSVFITTFSPQHGEGNVTFAAKFPGNILPVTLKAGESLICRKETFLCAEETVLLDIAWQQRLGAGFFAGQGFVLQRVTGPGTVWLDLAGEITIKDLAVGERLLVHAGHIGMQSSTITTDIQMIKGFKNFLFGGEGLFLATLTGPGKIWLQSMPLLHLAEEIARYLPQSNDSKLSAPAVAGAFGMAIEALLGNN